MRHRRLLGAILLGLLVLPAVLSAPDSAADLDSASHDGMRSFTRAVEETGRPVVTLFASHAALRGVNEDPGIVLVPGIDRDLTRGEASALQAQLNKGVEVWVFDELGAAGALTRPLGITVVPERLEAADPRFANPRVIVADARLDTRSFEILLVSSTALSVEPNVTVLARTHQAFRDTDRSGTIDASDQAGHHPVLVRTNASHARLLVAADAGLFTNDPLRADGYDNAALLTGLLDQAPDGAVVVDTSRFDPPRVLAPLKASIQGLLWVATSTWGALLVLLAAIGLAIVLVRDAPEREAWGDHAHDLTTLRNAPAEASRDRLRRLVIEALRQETAIDATELLAASDAELDRLAQQHLGEGQYLSAKGELEPTFKRLLQTLAPGGTAP